ncbi:hypothetical protein FOL47_011277 [Perkinsus chesapeaki]|uniref:Tubulin-specific chaperone D n=1 Tax=Perkinsus chesapeaki TaxID=330153 RepID=A0A7J6MMM9_PERCH|nr:hypothetical protein FOL47_011277 [Perkinsus chesapeaki]
MVSRLNAAAALVSPVLALGDTTVVMETGFFARFARGISSTMNGSGFVGAFVASFLMILCAEIGDKTFFIAAVLSMKHSHVVVFAGAIGALALMTVLSAVLGFLLPTLLSKEFTHYSCIVLFIYFGLAGICVGDLIASVLMITSILQLISLKLLKEAYDMGPDEGENEELKEVEMELKEKDEDTPPPSEADEECEAGRSSRRTWNCSGEALFSRSALRIFTQAFMMTFLAEWGDRSQISTIALASSKNTLGVTLGGIIGHCICTGIAVIGGKLLAKSISERHICIAGGVLFLVFAITSIWLGIEDEATEEVSVVGPVHVRGLGSAPLGHFPHEINLIEPVLTKAEEIVLMNSTEEEVIEGWESNCSSALIGHCERLHRAAALCLARLIAREDINDNSVKEDFFRQINGWSNDNKWSRMLVAQQLGKLSTLRNMPNDELISIVRGSSHLWEIRGVPKKKIVVGLCGRICAELVDRECPDDVRQARQEWRYRQAGGRRLCNGQSKQDLAPPDVVKRQGQDGEFVMRESVQSLVLSGVEDVIGDLLLSSLEDPVTVVRWTAAKALGRIANVLPSSAAVDVLTALTPDEDDGIRTLGSAHRMHGTSLAVAEMIRRLGSTALAFKTPEALGELLSKVARPAFECQPLPAARDAACYILWAVARGVCQRDIVQKNLSMVLRLLICSSLLDPSIVVRRAASAAAQEIVGRLGCTSAEDAGFLFVNLVDYWTVANRTYAATTLLGEVVGKLSGSDPELVPFVLDHLIGLHLKSNDKGARELAARSIGTLVPFTSEIQLTEYISQKLLPACLEEAASHPTTVRHGALLAVAEIVVACERLTLDSIPDVFRVMRTASEGLPGEESACWLIEEAVQFSPHRFDFILYEDSGWLKVLQDEPRKVLDDASITSIRNIVPKIEKARLYRGRGGEMIRAAACSLVQAIFYARNSIPLKANTIPRYIQSINSSIRHFTAAVQIAAAEALMALAVKRPGEITSGEIDKVEEEYLKNLQVSEENVAARRGYVLALALLSRARTEPVKPEVVSMFVEEANAWPDHPISGDLVDAETRRWAVVGLLAVARLEIVRDKSECAERIVRALLRCVVVDYATDSRGDVGRWVREDSARGLAILIGAALSTETSSSWRSALLCEAALASLIAASVSRLDHVRLVSSEGLRALAEADGSRGDACDEVYKSIRKGFEAPPKIPLEVVPPLRTSQISDIPTVCADVLELYRNDSKMNIFSTGLRSIAKFSEPREKLTILSSLVSSAGCLSHAVSREASEALIEVLKSGEKWQRLLTDLLLTLHKSVSTVLVFPTRADRDGRFAIPWLTTLQLLIDRELLSLSEGQVSELASATLAECRGSRNVTKLRECAGCFSSIYFGVYPIPAEAKKIAETALFCRLLCHEFPKVRHPTAKMIYEKSLQCADGVMDEDISELLIETDWTEGRPQWESAHSKICYLIGVEPPAVQEKLPRATKAQNNTFDYADFVREEYG